MLKNRIYKASINYLNLCLKEIEQYKKAEIRLQDISGSFYWNDVQWYGVYYYNNNGIIDSEVEYHTYFDELEDIDYSKFSVAAISDEITIRIGENEYVFKGCENSLLDYYDSKKQFEVFNPTKHITPKTLPLINLQVENFKQTIIEILDKYAENQEGDLNLKFVLFCNIAIRKYENNYLDLEQTIQLLNPNFLGNSDLVGILPKWTRMQYLKHYNNNDYNSLAKLIKVIYNQWKFRIDYMVFNKLDEYLLVFEMATTRLKLKEISVATFAITIDPKTFELYHLLDPKTQDLLINSYILNLKCDGDLQITKGELPDKHWLQIFDWIEETRRFVIESMV